MFDQSWDREIMGDTEEAHSERMLRLQSSFGTMSSSSSNAKQPLTVDQLNIPQPNNSQFRSRSFPQNFASDNNAPKRPPSHPSQIPPLSPYSQIPVTRPTNPQLAHQSFSPVPVHHSRSLSQPAFFSLDSLPPLSPSPFRDSLLSPTAMISMDQLSMGDASMEDRDLNSNLNSLLPPSSPSFGKTSSLPPRKAHRRSNSDIPFGFSSFGLMGGSKPGSCVSAQLVKKESLGCKEGIGERKYEGEITDDLFSAYMNLDGIEALNSSGTDEKNGNENREDLDSRASGSKTNGGDSSDNEAESSVNSLSEKREGNKRRAASDIAPTTRHHRSVSLDSFMGKLNFGDESPKVPLSLGTGPGQLSPSNSIDGNFSLEFGNGEFSEVELKKIMANDKLAEIALTDPKRVKRILANRQSAARSKERKTRYISELEHKVQTLQTEATTLSAQLTLLQRDSVGLTSQNNELKFRLQAMEQQAQLRDALSEALTAEVQRLKVALAEMNGESLGSKSMVQHLSVNSQMFTMQQQQQTHPSSQFNMPRQQSPQQQQQQQQQQQAPPRSQNGDSKQ